MKKQCCTNLVVYSLPQKLVKRGKKASSLSSLINFSTKVSGLLELSMHLDVSTKHFQQLKMFRSHIIR